MKSLVSPQQVHKEDLHSLSITHLLIFSIITLSVSFQKISHQSTFMQYEKTKEDAEKQTLKPFASKILISAGILSPNLTKIMSPRTTSSAGRTNFWPSLKTKASCGIIFLKLSIILELFASCQTSKLHINNIKRGGLAIRNATRHKTLPLASWNCTNQKFD